MKKLFIVLVIFFLTYFTVAFGKPKEPGDVILVGGGKMPAGLFELITTLKPKKNYVLISDDGIVGPKWDELFELANVEIIQPEQLTHDIIKTVSAILIDGGHQYEYLRRFNPQVLQTAHEKGVLIMGTSAGAMILGEFYFSAHNGTITSEEAKANPDDIAIGKDFLKIKQLKNALVDSHFSERDRMGRMRVFLEKGKASGLHRGIGIDEHTALCIHKDELTVIGPGGVHVIAQDSSCISYYQGGISNYSHSYGYLDQNL